MDEKKKGGILFILLGVFAFLAITQQGRNVASYIGQQIMQFSQNAVDLIASIEGFSPTPYPDAGGHSIGYGHFIQPGESFTSVTQDQALQMLSNDMQSAQDAVNRYVTVPLSQNQNDALVSFVYNVGAGNFSTSTLLKKLNAGDYQGAAAQFPVWNQSGHKVVQALVDRRAQEQSLFLS